MTITSRCFAVLTPLAVTAGAIAGSAQFIPLGQYGDSDFSQATSISNDGQFVGGHSAIPTGFVPIIWDGVTPNPLSLPPGFSDGGAYINALSGDGQSAVAIGPGPDGFRGIRWDASGTPHVLNTPPGTFSSFNCINFDGTATGGFTNQNFFTMESDAVIWTSAGGEQILGDLPGGIVEGSLTAVTDDGLLFAGYGNDGIRRPVTWDAVNGFQALSGIDGEAVEGLVIEIASNGTTIVGWLEETPAYWNAKREAHLINLWPGYMVGEAIDVVNDGSIIVGNWRETSFSDELGSLAFIWDELNGARPLQQVLEDEYNIDFGGWTLNQVSAITPDGLAMAGTGLNPDGELEAYKIELPSKPGTIGDLNGDGVVNVSDLLILLGDWGSCRGCPADLNGDGVVNVSDLLVLLANWG